jgi:hypothetical protein
MKTLIVEDDFTSRLPPQQLLKKHGAVHEAFNGREAVEAVRLAIPVPATEFDSRDLRGIL